MILRATSKAAATQAKDVGAFVWHDASVPRAMAPFVVAMLATGCHASSAESPPPETPQAAAAGDALAGGTGTGECAAEATRTVPVAMRPRSDERFGQLERGMAVLITARSIDDWLGFDPGVAQAANVGPFRLRWLDPALVTLHGDCARVQKVWAPEPHTCFEMAMEDVTVRAAPGDGASAVALLHPGEFGALVARSAGGWFRIELGRGRSPGRARRSP
jgi:hypothetical protein